MYGRYIKCTIIMSIMTMLITVFNLIVILISYAMLRYTMICYAMQINGNTILY